MPDVQVIGVSALLASRADQRAASNVDALAELLGVGHRRDLRLTAVASWVVARLIHQFEVESAALVSAQQHHDALAAEGAIEAAVRAERADAEARREAAARWSTQFADAMSDLISDVEHRWRGRSRALQRDFEEAIDGIDPATAWPEFEPQVYVRTLAVVTESWLELHTRINAVVHDVVAGLGEDGNGLLLDPDASDLLDEIGTDASLDVRSASAGDRVQSAFRSMYSSMGMVGALTSLAGLALAAPVTVIAAGLLGRKAFRDERERQLGHRRAQAKAAVRRYLDEVSFVYGKELRDAMRRHQRALRLQLAGVASAVATDAAAVIAAIEQQGAMSEEQRTRRSRDIEAELARLRSLASRIDEVRRAG
jgi:hypothetical protein